MDNLRKETQNLSPISVPTGFKHLQSIRFYQSTSKFEVYLFKLSFT